MTKVTQAHIDARKTAILEAAAACFASSGFHQATMQDIATEASLSAGAIYRYFPSKEAIIEAMTEEARRRNLALIEAAKEQRATQQVLDELARAFFGMLESPEMCAIDIELWAEALRNPRILEIIRRSFDSVREPFTEIVRGAQERGEINPSLDPDAVVRVMISFFHGLLLQKALDRGVDVWKYVTVVRVMMGGSFWQGEPWGNEA